MRTFTTNFAVRRLVEQARRHRAMNPRRRRIPRLPRAVFPGAAERRYRNILLTIVERMIGLVRERVLPALPRLAAEVQSLRPEPVKLDDWVSDLDDLLRGIKVDIDVDVSVADVIARSIAEDVSDVNLEQFRKQLKAGFGTDVLVVPQPWLESQMKAFQAQNVALIKSVPEDFLYDVGQLLQKGFSAGTDPRQLGRDLAERFDIPRNRAKLIARDQIGSMNGTLTMLRNQELGLTSYVWSTSNDERVRPSHAEREGKTFQWDDPPEDGPPGVPVACRCVALPNVEQLLQQIA
jgi:SPP1 gp7 family putative phage head morphogenesis protein